MNQPVTDFINKLTQNWQIEVCTQIRQLIHQSIPEVEERIQYGKPHFLKDGKYAAVLGPAKGWVSFTIFNAQALQPPDGLFESSDSGDRKTIKIREGQAVDYELLASLMRQAANSQSGQDKHDA
jgi:hypothetical protein